MPGYTHCCLMPWLLAAAVGVGSGSASAQSTKATAPLAAPAAATATLQKVASFDHQVTGVAVSEDGRIFVNFPRWFEDVPISIAELTKDGKLHPYPDAEWNGYRNAAPLSPGSHFVCVQAETADGHGHLWVIDPAAPATGFIVPGGPKLVEIDLKTNKVIRTYLFDGQAAPQGSYLNDVRLSPDGKFAYMTDSGAQGSLVVLDTATGQARRVLDGDGSTQVDKTVKVVIGGKDIHTADGRGVQFAADSISIDPKGEFLTWQPLTGKTLYRIATATLNDASLSPDQVSAKVETVSPSEPNDGLWQDASGKILFYGRAGRRDRDPGSRCENADDFGERPAARLARHIRGGSGCHALCHELGYPELASLQPAWLDRAHVQSLEDRPQDRRVAWVQSGLLEIGL